MAKAVNSCTGLSIIYSKDFLQAESLRNDSLMKSQNSGLYMNPALYNSGNYLHNSVTVQDWVPDTDQDCSCLLFF
jgi:hypothetical protein